MKTNYEHVSILIDRSGSMYTIKDDVIGGFNQFIEEQKKVPGEMSVSLLTFASAGDTTMVYDTVNLDDVKSLTDQNYHPSGGTALNDSFAQMIDLTGKKLASLLEDERPDKVLFVCISDGQENASKEHTNASLKAIIEHQKEKYGWEFIYIGANQDSFTEAQAKGITRSVNYMASSKGTMDMYSNLSASNASYRTTGKL